MHDKNNLFQNVYKLQNELKVDIQNIISVSEVYNNLHIPHTKKFTRIFFHQIESKLMQFSTVFLF